MPWVCPIIAEDPEELDYDSSQAYTPPRKRYTYGLNSRSRSRSSSASSSSSSGSPDRAAQGPRPHSLFWPPAPSTEDSDGEEDDEGRPTPRDFSAKEMQMLSRQQSGTYTRKEKRGREVLRFQPRRRDADIEL